MPILGRRARLFTYGRLVVFWVVFAALLVGSGAVTSMLPNRWARGAAQGMLVSSGMTALILFYSRRRWTQLSECGFGIDRGTAARFAFGVLLGLLLVAVPVSVLAFVDHVRWVRTPEMNVAAIAAALASYLLLACMEEIGFRSYPLLGLHKSLGLWTVQFIVAAAFIAYHVLGGRPWMSAVVGTGLGSLLFGMAAVASRGLALPIGLHAAWNIGSWALGDKGAPSIWTPLADHPPGASAAFAYVAAFLLWTLGFALWRRREARSQGASMAM